MQVTDLLIQKDLYLPLQLKGEKPADMKRDVWETMDTKAMSTIRLLLTRNVALSIRNEQTSYSLMQTLSNTYEKPLAVNKFFMMRKLYTQKLSEGGSVSDHLSLLTEIFHQLSTVEMQISDEQVAVILLLSLPESCVAIVSGIIN
ncbi:hypothetical protein MLD38_038306 [Melastoma candidum]|uniref:Uncharacterized protein n=1 Tax=Melastoma candidum TaxID=119954 RepID=A0ACB9KZ52_9MYRT|nr:hypothetical protein MLD38_038306 [Melastoma candidum]